ncbi:hypothetical protein MRB53_032982 [Persea americana]|uniref:Uncharacterized protein n=1 Tax=Persea americana TaxID=3435 RepID=A0ACC2KUG4_PERAE|nr:hypothetical protein MRB53_032982 [Persea americana]
MTRTHLNLRTTNILIGNEEEGMVFTRDETLMEIDEEAPNQPNAAGSEAIHAVVIINQASRGDEGNLESQSPLTGIGSNSGMDHRKEQNSSGPQMNPRANSGKKRLPSHHGREVATTNGATKLLDLQPASSTTRL